MKAEGVSVRKVQVAYGAVKVIQEMDLEIAPGEFIVLLGASGCGKSTLLSVIAGLRDVTAGQIWIGDQNATWAEPKDRDIGMVFQSYALYPQMSVRGNLSFGLRMADIRASPRPSPRSSPWGPRPSFGAASGGTPSPSASTR